MKIIMNCTPEVQKTKIYGQYFEWKPGQYKIMEDKFAFFAMEKRSHLGLAELPESFQDPQHAESPEGKQQLEEVRKLGVGRYADWLRMRWLNCTESLRQDLRAANIDTDPRQLASKGEQESIAKLAELKEMEKAQETEKVDKIKELEALIEG